MNRDQLKPSQAKRVAGVQEKAVRKVQERLSVLESDLRELIRELADECFELGSAQLKEKRKKG